MMKINYLNNVEMINMIVYTKHEMPINYVGPANIFNGPKNKYEFVITKILRVATREEYINHIKECRQEQFIKSSVDNPIYNFYEVEVLD